MPDLSTRPDLASTKLPSTPTMKTPKPTSKTKNEQAFVPSSMLALYYSYTPVPKGSSDQPEGTAAEGEWIPDDASKPVTNTSPRLILDKGFPTPVPSANEYVLKIQTAAFCQDELRLAAALNPRKTTPDIPLHSICGTVIYTPSEDHERPSGPRYKIGDNVFGVTSYTRDGGAADYALATEGELALKPPNISAAEAAALALPALTAWQALFKYGGLDPDAPANGHSYEQGERIRHGNGHSNGNGNGSKQRWWNGNGAHRFLGNGRNHGNGHESEQSQSRRGSHWWSGNGHGIWKYGVGNGNGNGHHWWNRRGSKNGNGNSHEQGNENGAEHDKKQTGRNGNGAAKRKVPPLRVLITNARDGEVGRIAVQLLRAEKLFNHSARPWICITCTAAEEDIVRQEWDVDEALIIPHLPAPDECDLGHMFRRKKWAPVDLVLDCTGGEVFRQAHSPSVIKEYGAVLTAVDSRPAQESYIADEQNNLGRRNRGVRSRFVPVNPDAAALGRIAEFVEDNTVRGRPESVVDLVNAAQVLEAGAAGAAGTRRGGMIVVRVN